MAHFIFPQKKTPESESDHFDIHKRKLSGAPKLRHVIFGRYHTVVKLNDSSTAFSSKSGSMSSSEFILKDSVSVRFGFVEVREHARLFVKNPQCQDGLGLGIDWKHSPTTTRLSVDLYEKIRSNQGKRTSKPLDKLCTYEKKMLLIEIGGYSEKVLWEAFRTKVHESQKKKAQSKRS
jgi:hypothetical protein